VVIDATAFGAEALPAGGSLSIGLIGLNCRTACPAQLKRHEDVFQRRECRDELKILKYKPHVRVANLRPTILVKGTEFAARKRDGTA
jgi:hypothetical protein